MRGLGLWLTLLSAPLAAQERTFPGVRVAPLVEDAGFNDEPSMAVTDDGSIWVAWVSFRDGADSLQVARYRLEGNAFRSLAAWQILGGRGTYVLRPQVVAAGDRVYLVYAAEQRRNWDVYAVECSARGPGKPLALGPDPAVDVDPAGAWHRGTLWVAWESNRGGTRRIYLTSLREGKAAPAEPVSEAGSSNYDPSVAVDSGGTLSVAWHRFADNNYDIWLRQRTLPGKWGPERRLTRAAGIDRHAFLFTRGDELWLAYENAQTERYFIGRTNQRRVIVAHVTPRGLETLAGYRDNPQLWERAEGASAGFDALGRLWVAYLKPRLPRGGWEHYLACHNGEKWIGQTAFSRRKGMDRRPALAFTGARALVAFQADDLPETWTQDDPALTSQAKSQILLGALELDQLRAPAVPFRLQLLAEPFDDFEAARLRTHYGEEAETPVIEYQGRRLRLYYGDLHAHSDISVCNRCGDQSIDENYQHRRDLNRLDFAAITDHGYNLTPYLWNYTAKLARVNEDPGRFVTFLAQEWTSSFEVYTKENPYGYYGHRNLILEDPYFPRWWNAFTGQTPAELWAELRRLKAGFLQIPHQLADTGNVPVDWRFTDEQAQPVAEIFQVRGSYEGFGAPRQAQRSIPAPGRYLRDVWNDGKVIGVIASPDHGGGYGKACVWAEELSRKSLLEAIRRRRTFATTAPRIVLDVRVNGHLMGEKVSAPPGGRVEVKVHVRAPSRITSVEICRNGEYIYVHQAGGREVDLSFLDASPPKGRTYYYVRVFQQDYEIAWSSPVWLGAPED
jgi:hypothetical protein